jgi:hypothetical protein
MKKYKKAPQAPRRFKSAYMFYSTEKHKQIREELSKNGDTIVSTNVHTITQRPQHARSHLSFRTPAINNRSGKDGITGVERPTRRGT